ncbi:hypothetical protein AVEN_48173-1, partial [Araneus ventricosus]
MYGNRWNTRVSWIRSARCDGEVKNGCEVMSPFGKLELENWLFTVKLFLRMKFTCEFKQQIPKYDLEQPSHRSCEQSFEI